MAASPAGMTIAAHGFFLIGEAAASPAPDLVDVMDLATGEGGTAERAISIELVIDGVARDGGYIMDASAIVQNDAKIENMRAMTDFTREYGVY